MRADAVVANTDPGMLWGRLVEPQHVGRRLLRRLKATRWSVSTLSLFLGVDMDLRAAGMDSGNVWFSRTTDIDASYEFAARGDLTAIDEVPGLFLNATTLKDPSMRRDGLHTVEAIAIASIDAFAKWKDLPRGRRGPEYAAFKEFLAEKILDAAECVIPGLRLVTYTACGWLRIPLLPPDVKPIADTIPGFNYTGWMGFFAPKNTPKAVEDRVRAAVAKTMELPEVKKAMAFQATEIIIRNGAEFRKEVQESMVENAALVKSVGLKATN